MDFLEVVQYFNNSVMTGLSSIASIIGFFMTLYVTFTVQKIRKFYIFNARVPEINGRLTNIASSISSQLNSFSGINTTISKILVDAEVDLSSLSRKVDGSLKKDIKSIILQIHLITGKRSKFEKVVRFFKKDVSGDDVSIEKLLRKIHLALYKVTKECQEKYEDARWEK